MSVKDEIKNFLAGLPEAKRGEVEDLHRRILKIKPKAKLWFLDGRDDKGKVVTNPNIGYGDHTFKYTDGTSREFYKVGLTATKTGISVYIMGIEDKKYLAKTYGADIGKAKVTGYCIAFKALKDINLPVLEAAVREALGK